MFIVQNIMHVLFGCFCSLKPLTSETAKFFTLNTHFSRIFSSLIDSVSFFSVLLSSYPCFKLWQRRSLRSEVVSFLTGEREAQFVASSRDSEVANELLEEFDIRVAGV